MLGDSGAHLPPQCSLVGGTIKYKIWILASQVGDPVHIWDF